MTLSAETSGAHARDALWLHATAIMLGEVGILLRGASGSGKSTLASRLIAEARACGLFAALIGDDRVAVRAAGHRVIAAGHPAIAGQIEHRGIGLGTLPVLSSGVIRAVIDLGETPERLPDPDAAETEICGQRLPRLAVILTTAECNALLNWALDQR